MREIGEIAVDGWQVFDSRRVDERADDVLRFDEGRLAGDRHILLNRANAEHDVNLGFLADAQDHVRALRGCEAGELDGELVRACRQAWQEVLAGRFRDAGPGRIRLDMPDSDRRAGQHATLLVDGFAAQRRQARLRKP